MQFLTGCPGRLIWAARKNRAYIVDALQNGSSACEVSIGDYRQNEERTESSRTRNRDDPQRGRRLTASTALRR